MRPVIVYKDKQGLRSDKVDYEGHFLEFGIKSGPYSTSSCSAAIVEDAEGFTHLSPLYLLKFTDIEGKYTHQGKDIT